MAGKVPLFKEMYSFEAYIGLCRFGLAGLQAARCRPDEVIY